MFKNAKVQTLGVLAVGALLGYGMATGAFRLNQPAEAKPAVAKTQPIRLAEVTGRPAEQPAECCTSGNQKSIMVAQLGKDAAPKAKGAAKGKRPNILFIMGDDIGWMQPGCYHRGLMVGETPNIDRIAREGAIFMDYVAMQSCTSGRCAFVTGMYPLRTGMIPPQLPGSPSYLRPGTPCIAKFLLDLGYTTGQFQ